MTVYYRNKITGKIEGKYFGCDTNSTKFRDTTKYDRFESDIDIPLDVSPVIKKEYTKLEQTLIDKGIITKKDLE